MKKLILLLAISVLAFGCSSDLITSVDWKFREMPSRMLGSFLFLCFMFTTFKPKLWIVGKISKCALNEKNKDGTDCTDMSYWFKVINANSFFKIHDLKFNLYILEEHFSGGKNVIIDNVELKRSDLPFLRSLTSGFRRTSHDEFACRLRTEVNLEDLLGRSKSLRLQVVAKHQLSGLTSYFTKDFTIDDIEEGRFKSGFSWKIIKTSR
jgi:hypothetical protein